MLKRCSLTFVTAVALLLSACATRPTAEWHDSDYAGPIGSVLIIGVSESQANRRLFEDTFVNELEALNVSATASTTLMAAEEKISRQTVEAAIDGKSIDSVLVARLLGVEERESYHQPVSTRYYNNYYSYYSQSWNYAYSGYYRKYQVLKLETNVYDVKSGKLVWSMQSESVDPQSASQVIKDQIEITIDTLRKRGLL